MFSGWRTWAAQAGRLWNDLCRDNQPLARLVQDYALKYAVRQEKATRQVDKTLVKGVTRLAKNHDFVCLDCGRELDKGERFCPECGTENPGYTPLADRKLPMNKGGMLKCACKATMRRRQRFCPECGKENPSFIAKKGGRVAGKAKKRRKAEKFSYGRRRGALAPTRRC